MYSTGVLVKLPKFSVPSFDGSLLNWSSFWEQFETAIHLKEQLTEAKKLVYLKDSLKDGPAGHVIEGLAQTSGNYMCTETIRPPSTHTSSSRLRSCRSSSPMGW